MAYEMVMPYHLHMPSYFLETFTEYPKLDYEKDFIFNGYAGMLSSVRHGRRCCDPRCE